MKRGSGLKRYFMQCGLQSASCRGLVMRHWLRDMIGRWRANRIRTKQILALHRTIEKNRATLDNGGILP